MLPILTPSDFIGVYAITQNDFKETDIQDYINTLEEQYIRQLLSDEAYHDISTQNPLSQKYIDLIDGVNWVDDCDVKRINKGLKEVLKYFIYYHYVGDNFAQTVTGNNSMPSSENAVHLANGKNTQIANNRYNRGLDLYTCDIAPFVVENDYKSTTVVNSIDNTGTYTLTCEDITYMQDGDEVTVNNTVYTASNVDTGLKTFDITEATVGLIFNDAKVNYEPFEDYNLPNLKKEWL
ncbi:MAG: hypothetical protein QNK20_16575 [Aureibaculum sp.]|nr:hypothetical protein [Aureibaculum sp.]